MIYVAASQLAPFAVANATSHEALDKDEVIVEETRNAARTLVAAVTEMRQGRLDPGSNLEMPRKK